jgi:hypothetical protein
MCAWVEARETFAPALSRKREWAEVGRIAAPPGWDQKRRVKDDAAGLKRAG